MFSLDSISTEMLKSILTCGAQALGSKTIDRLQKSRERSKQVRDYLQRVTNRVSYFVTYRPQPQHVDEAYVQPLVVDSALSQTYILPNTYEQIIEVLSESISKGLRGEELSKYIASRVPTSDGLVLQVKYISLDELTERYHSTLVLGEAGAGKSALLSYLCLSRLRSKGPRLPIFADARDLESKRLLELLNDILTTLQLSEKDLNWLDQKLSLYVDGLDELSPYLDFIQTKHEKERE